LNILAVGAHPDDLELLCAGTLAKYAKSGNSIYMYHTCNGDKGGFNKTSDEIRTERELEAKNSAKVINAKSFGGDFEDGNVYVNDQSKRLMVEIIRRCCTDVIITHHANDYHTDHINTSLLVTEANYMASIQNYKTKTSYLNKIPLIYFMDTLGGINFNPEYYVDISETMKIKLKMLSCHKSQVDFLRKHSNIDIIEWIEISGRYRGFQSGVKYSECFTQKIAWPVGKSKNLLP
jgi:LmbE family N-acetylglucosaminyl deacetylase